MRDYEIQTGLNKIEHRDEERIVYELSASDPIVVMVVFPSVTMVTMVTGPSVRMV